MQAKGAADIRDVKRGQIYLCEITKDETGNIQAGKRPVVIIQNDQGNRHSPLSIVVPLTSVMKSEHLPTHIEIKRKEMKDVTKGLEVELVTSLLLCEQIHTVQRTQLEEYMGYIDLSRKDIIFALALSIGINYSIMY